VAKLFPVPRLEGATMMLFLGLCLLLGTLIMVVGGVKFPFLPW
jgi:hypothetical protein